jgi:hypothetical protein
MKSDQKFEVFYTFYKAVIQNAKTNNFNNVRMKDIKNKQKEFEKFIIREDSLHHSFPPLQKKSCKIHQTIITIAKSHYNGFGQLA